MPRVCGVTVYCCSCFIANLNCSVHTGVLTSALYVCVVSSVMLVVNRLSFI